MLVEEDERSLNYSGKNENRYTSEYTFRYSDFGLQFKILVRHSPQQI